MPKPFRIAGPAPAAQANLFALEPPAAFEEAPPRKPVGRAGPGLAPMRIAIEGPVRAGKSTLARLLAERMGAALVAEPETNPFLHRFYAGEPGMAFAAQTWFLHERVAQMRAASEVATRLCRTTSSRRTSCSLF